MSTPVQERGRITPLSRPTSRTLRSTLVIPTYPSVLQELIHNSLDAEATKIDIWLDVTPGDERIRVADDGWGMTEGDLKRVGGRYESSKDVNSSGLGSVGSFGFRGEALSSIAALGLVDITTRRRGGRKSLSKVIKGSSVLYQGPSTRSITGPSGTVVVVKDLFHNVPVRQNALASASPNSMLSDCRKVTESLALARPQVKWTLWAENAVGTSASGTKKLIAIEGARDSLDVFRTLYGTANVEMVQKIRVTAGKRKVEGFISLQGVVNRNHQHLYVNSYPLERGDIHHAISKRIASSRFSVMTADEEAEEQEYRRSPRKLERYPIYVLNLTLPPSEVDAAYTPQKTRLGYKDTDAVVGLVLAVVDEFLSRHGFKSAEAAEKVASPSKTLRSRITQNAAAERFRDEARALSPSPRTLPVVRRVEEISDTIPTPVVKRRREAVQQEDDDDDCLWLEDILNRRLPSRASCHTPETTEVREGVENGDESLTHHEDEEHTHCHRPYPRRLPPLLSTDLTFSAACLDNVRMLEQVDNKFLACVLSSDATDVRPSQPTIVLIDQHAADERVAVEAILEELCKGFLAHDMPTTSLERSPIGILITREEANILWRPGVLEVFHRWGISLKPAAGEGPFTQVSVAAVPTLLASRLGHKEGKEVKRLIQLYLSVLDQSLSELQVLLGEAEREEVDWGRALRWMPREMRELANSKACRGAIMFGDKLDSEQCQRLVTKLRATRQPFICAHGRPSLVPLIALEGNVATTRRIEWSKWRK